MNTAITIVSGLPRTGTSMTMKMLEAGGISPLGKPGVCAGICRVCSPIALAARSSHHQGTCGKAAGGPRADDDNRGGCDSGGRAAILAPGVSAGRTR